MNNTHHTKISKIGAFAGSMVAVAVGAVALVLIVAGVAQAQAQTTTQTSTLAAACSGSVSGNQVTWIATSTGGNPPVAFLWSGDPSVAGQTSGSLVETYTTNGTYTAGIQATDAS